MLNDQEVIDLLIVRVSGRDCALPLIFVQEVVPVAALLKPPTMPRALEGFLNLAGVMHPVIRLDRVLGLPEFSLGLYTPILVLKGFPRPLAFLAESAVRVVNLPAGALHPMPSGESWNGCVRAEFSWNDAPVALLDPAKLVLLEEESTLRDFNFLAADRTAGFAKQAGERE